MEPKLGLSSKVVQDRPLKEALQIAARCGYTGLELFGVANHLPVNIGLDRARDARRQCDDLGLKVVTICSYVGGFAESGDREATIQIEDFRRYVEVANILGCDMIRVWPDDLGRNIRVPRDDHWLRAAHYFRMAADLSLAAGVRVLIENHLTLAIDADSTLRLIRTIDRPNVVVSYDPANMFLADRPYGREAILRLGSLIQNVQVKAARRGTSHPEAGGLETASTDNSADLLLGDGNIDHDAYLRPLTEIGYQGYYMAECHKIPTAELPSDEIAAREFRAMAELLGRG